MTSNRRYPFAIGALLFLMGCASASSRKSSSYYLEHKETISEIRSSYDSLYQQQPFSSGFTDKSCKYFDLEVLTDSIRYVYNTENNRQKFYETVMRFKYDTASLRRMILKMEALKCLWLSKASFYVDEKKETVEYLSFQSTSFEAPFQENKYYILIFVDHPVSTPGIRAKLRKGDLVKIDEHVYFTIGSKFR